MAARTALIKSDPNALKADAFFVSPEEARQRHTLYPVLYDVDGRPAMSVATADEFLHCQELAENPDDPKTWRNASMSAAMRAMRHVETMDACRKYVILAVHCLNKAADLEKQAKRKKKWVTRRVAERYIRRFGGGLYLYIPNPHWLYLKNRDEQFVCYVA